MAETHRLSLITTIIEGDHVKLTMHQKHLILGLRLFDLTEEEQKAILLLLETEKEQVAMIDYLLENQHATQQDILTKLAEITG